MPIALSADTHTSGVHDNSTSGGYLVESSVVIFASVTHGTLLILNAVDILQTLPADDFAVQGGAVNRGLFFADPPPSPLGAVSGKISKNRWAAA
jgi:hypothetical protein